MNDYPAWIPHELTEVERIAAVRWALGLEATDTSFDARIRVELAIMALAWPQASEYEQRYQALEALWQFRATAGTQ